MRVFVVLLLTLSACAQMSEEQRRQQLESFDMVWRTVRDRFWDPAALEKTGWEKVREEMRPRVEKAQNAEEVRAVLREMLGRLGQSHFGIVPGDLAYEIDAPVLGDGTTGIEAQWVENAALVTRVEAGSSAAAAGVKTGWRIVSIDGRPVDEPLRKIAVSFSGQRKGEYQVALWLRARLSGNPGSEARIEFEDGAGKGAALALERRPDRGTLTRFGFLPAQRVWFEARKLEPKIGYTRFNLFLDPAGLMPQFEKAVKECLRCDGFIIDLRGNPGGLGAMAMGMAGFFVEEQGKQLGVMTQREMSLNFIVTPRAETYTGPLAVLVDGGSGSTAEIFVGGMQDLGRAKVFGTTTMGAALPSMFTRLPNGDGFQYAVADYVSQSGRRLEGGGVVPDVATPLTRRALLEGKDVTLDAALNWIHEQSRARSGASRPPAARRSAGATQR